MATSHAASSSWRTRLLRAVAAVPVGLALLLSAAHGQTWQDEVDYTLLKSRLGDALPLGAGGVISQVEAANSADAYYVTVGNSQFTAVNDPDGVPLSITDGSGGAANGNSGHATSTVGAQFYGNTASMAPSANTLVLYEANDWLTNVLRANSSAPPDAQPYRVQNYSWVGTYGNDMAAQDQSALRRLDYLIETSEMIAVAGAGNYNPAKPNTLNHAKMMVHSYNAIVVGRSDGFHSRGATGSIYGPGRYRPDIVVPRPSASASPAPTTSRSTATVSSAATLLKGLADGTDAARSETIKALLLAGATKQEFVGFVDPATSQVNSWDRTPTRPLDDLFGAGELNIYNSYLAHLEGQHAGSEALPTSSVGSYGWDYQDHKGDNSVGDIFYNFEVPAGSTADELSIILAWNAEITDTNNSPGIFTPVDSLQNLDLRFYTSAESVLGEPADPLRTSVSTDHNVEHIYLTNLGSGTYTLKISGAADWDYGLAWRMATRFDEVSADFNEDGVVDGDDLLAWQLHLGALINATHADGDADGDGDVDGDDLSAWEQGLMPAPPLQVASAPNVAGVPEPSTMALAALAAVVLLLFARSFQRRWLRA